MFKYQHNVVMIMAVKKWNINKSCNDDNYKEVKYQYNVMRNSKNSRIKQIHQN